MLTFLIWITEHWKEIGIVVGLIVGWITGPHLKRILIEFRNNKRQTKGGDW